MGIVCIFGLIKVGIQTFFPPAPAKPQTVNLTASKISWKLFTKNKYNFSVDYPDSLKATDTPYTTVFDAAQSESSHPGFPLLYISVIPDGFNNSSEIYSFMTGSVIDKIFTIKDNETLQTETGVDSQYWSFKRLAALPVAGTIGVMIQNNNVWQGEGLINRRILIRKNGFTYVIGSYYNTQPELDTLQKFLTSFKFLK